MSSCFVNKGLMFTYYEFCGSARPVVMSSCRALLCKEALSSGRVRHFPYKHL